MDDAPPATPWFFYNSVAQIDDPLNFIPTTAASVSASPAPTPTPQTPDDNDPDATDLDSDSPSKPLNPPVFSLITFSGSLSPLANNWTAFNPNDNQALLNQQSPSDTVLVGHKAVYGVSHNLLAPVYWQSVRDTAQVHRAEWVFSSSLTPVDTSLEQAVDKAFRQIRPWTLEYIHELRSAQNVPDALDKIKVPIEYTLNLADNTKASYTATVVFAACYTGSLADSIPNLSEQENIVPLSHPVAYLFTPYLGTNTLNPINLLTFPTTAQLVSALLAGKPPPGMAQTLQRHFEWPEWKKQRNLPDRPSDHLGYVPPPVTQLVLVIHGIGQKLSDRVESFNFTYAINGFSVLITELMASPNVNQYLPENANILVLPVNWRRTLDFEALKEGTSEGPHGNYTLDQITMKSIPSVRSLITDVMLDIPFYMSHFKSHMVSATVKEANRIYKLFTKYNPGFESYGNTHIIGHSLGSAIAMDILSTQPFDVQKSKVDDTANFLFNTQNLFLVGSPAGFFLLLQNAQLAARTADEEVPDPDSTKPNKNYGKLSVKNIYNILHHSDPISYFLNPTVDAEYAALIETATMPNDKQFPVVNPAAATGPGAFVEPNGLGFFDSLKSKFLGGRLTPDRSPSSSRDSSVQPRAPKSGGTASGTVRKKSFLSGANIDRELLAAAASADDAALTFDDDPDDTELASPASSPSPPLPDLPVEVELQERDYTALRQAERRMYLLNHNGQIDFVIPLQGALENQYLSMLTAHSGYWENKDFARMVALECGRSVKPAEVGGNGSGGRVDKQEGLPQYAVKKKKNLV